MRLALSFLKGALIGAGAILPGLSGASLAVTLGVYEDLTTLVGHPFTGLRAFIGKNTLLLAGAAIGFVAMSRVLSTLLSGHMTEVLYLFSGFIAGTVPGLWRRGRTTGAGPREYAAFGISCAATLALAFWSRSAETLSAVAASGAEGATGGLSPVWAASGAIVGAGSLLPGVSASFFLVYLGWYDDLIAAVSRVSIPELAQVGAGAGLTLFTLSRIASWLYRRFCGITSFAVVGITLGSLALVLPSPLETPRLPLCAGLFALAFATSLAFDATVK